MANNTFDAKKANTQGTALKATAGASNGNAMFTGGPKASVGLYSALNDATGSDASRRSLMDSRLWHGVPQLTEDQMRMFEAAYTGHQFFFVTGLPKFMISGAFSDPKNNMNTLANNLKAIIERCCVSFSGASSITANTADQEDGAGRKITHITGVQKEQNDISLKLHEFAGLPVKNAIEAWMQGTYDYRSQHGNYYGNLGIDGGWCLANHTMSILVVQVNPSWNEIQDAAYYTNMFPSEVPFDHFNFDKGESQIVADYDLSFKCNEIRSAQVNAAAEAYMNNKILHLVQTEVYDRTKFKPINPKNISALEGKTDNGFAVGSY